MILSGAKYPDMESCIKDQTSKGKDDNAAKKICGFLDKTNQIGAIAKGDYVEPKDLPKKEDFKSVGECVKHCIDVLGKTEEQANTFCTKLFEAPTEEATRSSQLIRKYLPSGVPENDKYFVKAFLLDDTVNLNQWGVNADSIPKNIATFIGKPLVLTDGFDHPVVDDMSYTHALQYQDIYRIGTIVDIVKMDKEKNSPYGNSYFAIIEVTNPAAKAAFQAETLPLYVSPAIAQMVHEEDPTNLKDWLALHLAIVDDPAYTMKKAMITGKCGGDTETCLIRLRQAHIEKFGYGNCGFCIKGKLLSVLNASQKPQIIPETQTLTNKTFGSNIGTIVSGQTMTVSGTSSEGQVITVSIDGKQTAEKITESLSENGKLNTSHQSEKQKINQVHMDSNTNPNNLTQGAADVPNTTAPATETPNTVPATTAPAQNQAPVQKTVEIDFSKSGADRATIVNAENIQFKAENTILKEQKAALEKELETYKSELHGIKENLRRERIATIVNNVIVDEATKDETIKFFMESKLQPEQVEAIYQSVGGVKKASVQPSTTPNYEPRMPMTRTARKTDVSEHDYEALFGLGDYIVKDDGGAN